MRDLLIDLSRLSYMSSLGISAIHETALVFRGLEIPEKEAGWTAYNAIDRDRGNGVQKHVKLLSPRPKSLISWKLSGSRRCSRYIPIWRQR